MIKEQRIAMEDFKGILNEEIQVYNRVEKVLAEKKDIIIRGNVEELNRIDVQLEQLMQQAHHLEKSRLAVMLQFGRERESLRDFISSLEDDNDSRLLEQSRRQMIQVTQNIKSLSDTNRTLLTQSIRLIEQSVQIIASLLAPEGAAYSNPVAQKPLDERTVPIPALMSSTIIREA